MGLGEDIAASLGLRPRQLSLEVIALSAIAVGQAGLRVRSQYASGADRNRGKGDDFQGKLPRAQAE